MSETEAEIGALVAQALGGDKAATAVLYRLYEKRLIAIAHRKLGHTLHSLVESVDLVQSAWADALASLHTFEMRGEDSFFRWLHTCLLHKISQKRRHFHAQKRDAGRTKRHDDIDTVRRQSGPTPSQAASYHEQVAQIMTTLERFPCDQREVLLLRMRDERSFLEIAEQVGKSLEAVKKVYQRSLARLIQALPREWRQSSA